MLAVFYWRVYIWLCWWSLFPKCNELPLACGFGWTLLYKHWYVFFSWLSPCYHCSLQYYYSSFIYILAIQDEPIYKWTLSQFHVFLIFIPLTFTCYSRRPQFWIYLLAIVQNWCSKMVSDMASLQVLTIVEKTLC